MQQLITLTLDKLDIMSSHIWLLGICTGVLFSSHKVVRMRLMLSTVPACQSTTSSADKETLAYSLLWVLRRRHHKYCDHRGSMRRETVLRLAERPRVD